MANSIRPPGLSVCHRRSSRISCCRAVLAASFGRRSHLMSGWRQATPEAGHVGQNGVERLVVPPVVQILGGGAMQLRVQAEPCQVVPYALQTDGVDV